MLLSSRTEYHIITSASLSVHTYYTCFFHESYVIVVGGNLKESTGKKVEVVWACDEKSGVHTT